MNKDEKKNKLLKICSLENYVPMSKKELISLMSIPKDEETEFFKIIKELKQEGKIIKYRTGKIVLTEKLNYLKGVFLGTEQGFGFVTLENEEKDVFINKLDKNGAIHKDTVLISINKTKGSGKRKEGKVVKILEREIKNIVGTFNKNKNFGFVVTDEKKIGEDIYISKKNSLGAVNGHKVVVEIIKTSTKDSKPEGKITEILGHKNDPKVDMLVVLKQYGIEIDFSDDVYKELNMIDDYIQKEELENRLDLREELIVTIDGEDAKDLDDGVSIQKLENGNYKLGVHIADVSHYVKEYTDLDRDAYERGTSVYLPNSVIPMLPHKLSNEICSLNPNVDRLALSCIMEINEIGDVVNHEIKKSVINIKNRMTYTIVNDLLENEDSKYRNKYEHLMYMFKLMKSLCKVLKDKRIKRGSIDFDFPESKIILDSNGKAIDIKLYVRNIATEIIEEFMLITNETVAEHFYWLELPFAYRSHEEPDVEKLLKLSNFVNGFGYFIKGKHSKSLQELLSKVKNTSEEKVINKVVLRSLKQAKYTKENIGHFGLASKYYCHFTSPIRRYPDLQIHRIIKKHIDGGLTKKYHKYLKNNIDEICLNCSVKERRAELVERDINDIKKIEYMEDKIGKEYEGVLSGVTRFGIYVELSNTVEGMVRVDDIKEDRYILHEEKQMYIGERSKKIYRIGDNVKIKVYRINKQDRNIDFIFI